MESPSQAGAAVCGRKCVLHVFLGIQGSLSAAIEISVWRLLGGTDRVSKEDNYITDVIDRACFSVGFIYLCLA